MKENDDIFLWKFGQMSRSRAYSAAAKGKGTASWSAYWATLISATVENAAPTNVVLTFPTAQTSLGASDFTIAGFTISSASWADAVLTLTLSYAVTAYAGNLTITFVRSGETAAVTNNVAIANTVGWYVSGDGSSIYVTKDANDLVSVWKDLSGTSHPLLQGTGTNQPKWETAGILFDGNDNFLKASFTFNQPEMIYAVINQKSWADADCIIDGASDHFVMNLQQYGTTPGLLAYAGTLGTPSSDLAINVWGIVRILFNGANSSLQINKNSAVTGNFGSSNAGGITLGYKGKIDAGTNYANFQAKELIFRTTADNAATQSSIYNYLANKYGFALI